MAAGAFAAGSFGFLVAVAADPAVGPRGGDLVVLAATLAWLRPFRWVAGFAGPSHRHPSGSGVRGERSGCRV